ncbi:MAG: hypothetical protein WDO19_09770 [Bacteroidota bacterium]
MRSFIVIVLVVFLWSCKKDGSNHCQDIQDIYLTSNGPVTIGDTLKIYTQEVGGYRVYKWSGPDHFMSQDPRNTIYDAELKNEGWYYLSLSNNECNTKVDSIYVDVKLQQGTASCSVIDNTCTYTNLAADSYSYIFQHIDPTFGFLTLAASGTATMEVYFHDYWKTHEPEDGIYKTIDIPSFGIDGNYNKVFISTVKSNVYFSSRENQTVYVSHVNGKLQVRFCDITMGGTNNSFNFTTVASGNLIQQ